MENWRQEKRKFPREPKETNLTWISIDVESIERDNRWEKRRREEFRNRNRKKVEI